MNSRPQEKIITVTINGLERSCRVEPNLTLLELIRDDFALTGTKYSCGIGECGACTVLLNGRPILSCLYLATLADGCEVSTIEGLSAGNELHPLQQSFADHGAVQCGFCSPGMIMTASALLAENAQPSKEEIGRYLGGNLCRCTGYEKIVEAVENAGRDATREKVVVNHGS